MHYIKKHLKAFMDMDGLSGFEEPIANYIRDEWKTLVDEVTTTKTGSVHGIKIAKKASSKGRSGRSMMIVTHMDAIGMMVTGIDEGFLHFTDVGGIDQRILPGTPVLVHGTAKNGSPKEFEGLVVAPHPRSMPNVTNGSIPIGELLVDIGLNHAEATEYIQIGDLVSFNTHPFEHSEDIISGHSADNRASVTALTHFLKSSVNKTFDWTIIGAATSQEEVSFAGAYTSSKMANPDLAIVIDVTFAKGPGSSDWRVFQSGKGITLGLGPNIHTGFMRRAMTIAEQNEIPVSLEPMPRHSGTDAYAVQVANNGIPTIVIGIPLKYMHTPVEMVNLQDIKRVSKLLSAIADELDEEFLQEISWDKDKTDAAS